jgi:hypothetical protein
MIPRHLFIVALGKKQPNTKLADLFFFFMTYLKASTPRLISARPRLRRASCTRSTASTENNGIAEMSQAEKNGAEDGVGV